MLIRISGNAEVTDGRGNRITDLAVLKSLDGLLYDDEKFTDHLGGPARENALVSLLEEGGILQFQCDLDSGQLRVITEYRASRRLKKKELAALVDYTIGQWSDGIGESFHDESIERCGYHLACQDDAPVVEQIDDGHKTKAPQASFLFVAAKSGDVENLRQALDSGCEIDARYRGQTPLHAALSAGRVECALILIDRGADVNVAVEDEDGYTPLTICAASIPKDEDAVRIAQALVDHGADPAPKKTGMWPTPLEYAGLKSKPKLEELLDRWWRQKRAYVPKSRRKTDEDS
jgi:hypothetical protein